MENTLSAILENTFTVADARRRLDIAQTFFEHERFGTGSTAGVDRLREFYKNAPDTSSDVEAIAAWGEEFFLSLSGGNFYGKLREIKSAIDRLPVVTIYVPIAFTNDLLARLGQWCRKNIRPEILLDVRVNPETIGGCGVAYGSAFQDLSFKHFAEASRPAITKLVHSYGV